MTRKAHLETHLSSSELKQQYQSASDKVESRRWHLLWLVSEHWTLEQAAEVVGIDYDYAKEIVGKYNKYGATGLRNRRHDRQHKRGKPLLNREQIIELRERLQTPPPDQGLMNL
jgi:molybdenum-dependent DNA-binding transcriptional regulator ModE